MPLHLLAALNNEETGIISNLINICSADFASIKEQTQAEINRIPKVQVQGGE